MKHRGEGGTNSRIGKKKDLEQKKRGRKGRKALHSKGLRRLGAGGGRETNTLSMFMGEGNRF